MFRFTQHPAISDMRLRALDQAEPARVSFDRIAKAPAPVAPAKVVVVGAGISGLCVAYELEKHGHRVVILEAERAHFGGRVRTTHFGNGQYGEFGAMRIPETHQLTRHYVKEFGLTLRPFVQTNPKAYYFIRGQRVRIGDAEQLKKYFSLLPGEQKLTIDDIWARGVPATLKELNDEERRQLLQGDFTSPKLRELDQISLQQLQEKAGLSQDAIELLSSAWGLETQLLAAATEHLREELKEIWVKTFDEIVGGMSKLPEAFVERLKQKPRQGCEVIALEHGSSKATAIYTSGKAVHREEGDFLVCTLPLPVLNRIPITPPLSPGKQRAIRQVSYDSATKVLALSARRFWETDDGIYGGGSAGDSPTVFTYYPSDNAKDPVPAVSQGPGVLLASYSWGGTARRLGLLPVGEIERVVRASLESLHPQLKGHSELIEAWRHWSWDNHPWSMGAFSWFVPDQHVALYKELVRDEGRILLAGEHMSLTHTWIQGALESALATVASILQKVASSAVTKQP
jgi:monoamine oxidase